MMVPGCQVREDKNITGMTMFKKNMHMIDRVVRACASLVLIYFGFIDDSWINSNIIPMILGVFGIANMFAALSGFCPVYVCAKLDFYNQDPEE